MATPMPEGVVEFIVGVAEVEICTVEKSTRGRLATCPPGSAVLADAAYNAILSSSDWLLLSCIVWGDFGASF